MTISMVVPEAPVESASLPICRIALPQRFDVHAIADFTAMVVNATGLACVLLVDASMVRYIDRSGIDSLIDARLRCLDRGGDLVLLSPSLAARITLELAGRYKSLNPVDSTTRDDSSARSAA